MCPKSLLEAMSTITGVYPVYMNAAALTNDPIERMKLVMASSIAFLYPTHYFEKPVLNIYYPLLFINLI